LSRLSIICLLLVLAATAAGCGASSSGGSPSSSAGTTRSFTAFTTCLKQHGVKPLAGFGGGGQRPSGSRPTGGSRPQPSAKRQQALAACRQYAPQGGQGGFGQSGN
jgi:hypothetical protein